MCTILLVINSFDTLNPYAYFFLFQFFSLLVGFKSKNMSWCLDEWLFLVVRQSSYQRMERSMKHLFYLSAPLICTETIITLFMQLRKCRLRCVNTLPK